MRNSRILSKSVFLLVLLFIAEVFAVGGQQFNSSSQSSKRMSPQERRQQLEQEAPTAMTAVDTAYKEILSYVHSAQSPAEEDLKNFLKTVVSNRKYTRLKSVSDLQRSTYHILSAWAYYFDGKQDKAAKEALSGQKAASENQNTVKTRFALSLICKDYNSAAEALTGQDIKTRRTRPGDDTESQYSQQPTDDILLDVNAVRTDLLGKTFALRPEPVQILRQSIGPVACVLLWKIEPNELSDFTQAEANEPAAHPEVPAAKSPTSATSIDLSKGSSPVANPLANPVTQPQSVQQQEQQSHVRGPANELAELSQLQDIFGNDKRVVFAAINLNNPEKKQNLENWLGKYPQPLNILQTPADQQQKAAELVGETDKPIFLIIGPDATIRYAGDVNGFLPQMIIQNILQNPAEFVSASSNKSNLPAVESSSVKPNMVSQTLNADTNKTDVNTVSAPAMEKTQQPDDILAAADEYEAEKLLSNARTFLQIGNKLPSHTYRQPVEMCRRVMKDYPDTKYAQEAQMLLRNVPKEYRSQYEITDQELGL